MRKTLRIFTILLAILVFLSPVLSFASVFGAAEHHAEMEMNCCPTNGSADSQHDCCHSGTLLADNKNCGENSCPTHDCHLHQVNIFHVYFPENSSQKEIQVISVEKLKSDNYSSLTIRDLSFSFWNPPKYIS